MDGGLEKALDRLDREVDRVFGLNDSPSYRSKSSYSSKTGFATEYTPGGKGDSYRYSRLWSPTLTAEPTTPSPHKLSRWTHSTTKTRSYNNDTPTSYNLCQSGGACCGGSCGKNSSSDGNKMSLNDSITLNPAGYSSRSYFKTEKSIADDIGALRGKFATPAPTYEYRSTHWDNSFSDLDSYLRKQRSRLDRMSTTLTGLEEFVHNGFADPKFL